MTQLVGRTLLRELTKLILISAERACNCIIVPRMRATLNDTLDGESAPEGINQVGTNIRGTIMQLHNRSADEC